MEPAWESTPLVRSFLFSPLVLLMKEDDDNAHNAVISDTLCACLFRLRTQQERDAQIRTRRKRDRDAWRIRRLFRIRPSRKTFQTAKSGLGPLSGFSVGVIRKSTFSNFEISSPAFRLALSLHSILSVRSGTVRVTNRRSVVSGQRWLLKLGKDFWTWQTLHSYQLTDKGDESRDEPVSGDHPA